MQTVPVDVELIRVPKRRDDHREVIDVASPQFPNSYLNILQSVILPASRAAFMAPSCVRPPGSSLARCRRIQT